MFIKNKNSFIYVLIFCFFIAMVCGLAVSSAAIALRPIQEVNERIAQRVNILDAIKISTKGKSNAEIDNIFNKTFEVSVVDLHTGKMTDKDPSTFVLSKMLKDKNDSIALNKKQDIAKIGRRENYELIYIARKKDSSIDAIIFPIRGYGLWSTIYGYLALESDFNTIRGITFTSHGETPGLGGEIDNPKWKAAWEGKKLFSDENAYSTNFSVLKNGMAAGNINAVDAISGATLTSNGVENLVRFWFGKKGYSKMIWKNKQHKSK